MRTSTAIDETTGSARNFAWGFVAQGCSSATNFGLSVMAGRLLGPSGLGIVFIGFVAYQLVLGLQRAIVTQPLIAQTAPLSARDRLPPSYAGLTITLTSGLAASLLLVIAGLAVGGDVGRAFLLFAPWISGGLVHEYWKAILFQEGRGGTAALTDAARLAIIALAVPVALDHKSDYVIVGAWGLAALAGFGVGTIKLRPRFGRIIEAFSWLRGETLILGRWLGAREVVYQLGSYVVVLILAAVIGSADLGGLRSAEALFSPFSLIAAAFAMPALPALSRALASSRDAAQRMAILITGVATLLGVAYFAVMVWIGGWLLVHLFGSSFSSFRGLIWPMAAAQLFYVGSFAFTALLIAEKRGAELFVVGVVGAITTVGFTTALAVLNGVSGAAWGMAAAAGVASVLVVALGFRKGSWDSKGERAPG